MTTDHAVMLRNECLVSLQQARRANAVEWADSFARRLTSLDCLIRRIQARDREQAPARSHPHAL